MREIRNFVLGNPKAWLGTAYHEVLENLWIPSLKNLSDAELVEYLWNKAIDRLREAIASHPLNRRYAVPEKWPGYHLARSFVQIRANETLAEDPRHAAVPPRLSTAVQFREHELTAMNGKLVGKPDVVLADEIRDYKSGNVYEDTPDGNVTVKNAYVRQLRIYGYLVYEQLGRCPSKGILMPMQGQAVEIDLDTGTSLSEAMAAVALLDSFNDRLRSVSVVADLAKPAPDTCRWCQFKALCPAFWGKIDATWAQELGSGAVRGVLDSAPKVIHNGLAFSILINVSSGTTQLPQVQIAPLAKDTHPHLGTFEPGEEVRIVGLYRRNDGQFAPTIATVCLRDADCPSFSLPPHPQ